MVVDKQGWDDVASLLAETLDRVLEIQAESSARLAESDEDGHALEGGDAPLQVARRAEALERLAGAGGSGAAQGLSGAAASGVATTKEKLSSR